MYPERKIRLISQEELNDPTRQLFDMVFMCRIEYIYTLDPEFISEYGTVSSGDFDEDLRQSNSTTVVGLTIPKMIEHYRNNVPFALLAKTDDRKIYELIHTHIKRWRVYATQTVGGKTVPLEDLTVMSEFASAVYDVRDRTMDVKKELDKLGGSFRMEGSLLPSAHEVFRSKDQVKEEKKKQMSAPAPHLDEVSGLERILYGSII